MSVLTHIELGSMSFGHSLDLKTDERAFPLHCHDVFEIYFFIRGEGYYLIEGNRYELRPYSLLVMRPGEMHRFEATSQRLYERFVINFTPSFLSLGEEEAELMYAPFLKRELGRRNLYQAGGESGILEIYESLDRAAALPEQEKRLIAKPLLELLLARLYLMSRQAEQSPPKAGRSAEIVGGVLKYINENMAEPLTLDGIASRFYISKYYLSRLFKSHTGVSVIDYVIRKRVFLSQQLMKEGLTPAQACAKAGFGDYSTFYRSFRRIVGRSPQEMERLAVGK